MTPSAATQNGHTVEPRRLSQEEIADKLLGPPRTEGYRSSPPYWGLENGWMPQIYVLRDIELMITHPIVAAAMGYFKCGVAGAEFWGGPSPDKNPEGVPICPSNPEIGAWVKSLCERFWDRGMPLMQGGYDYGWIGLECLYEEEAGRLTWAGCDQFCPRDVYLLTQNRRPVGIRVKNVLDGNRGEVDLWLASKDVPAKGLWYAHAPRYGKYYGRSQCIPAWRPWRRLAWIDGAETVIDTGVYRFAFSGPHIGYPEEDMAVPAPGVPGTTLDSQGLPRRFARDWARQMAEQAKAGAGFGYPTTQYPPEMGGGPKWIIDWPDHAFDVDPLINYAKYLHDSICYGCGVPPELIQALQGGSGYSGRSVTVEAFLYMQQQIADAMLHVFVKNVVAPLVRFNWGDVAFNVQVKNLLESKMATKQQQQPGAGEPAAPEIEGNSTPGWPRTPEQTQANTDQLFSLEEQKKARIKFIADKILSQARRAA
jgi:hypothetical protein